MPSLKEKNFVQTRWRVGGGGGKIGSEQKKERRRRKCYPALIKKREGTRHSYLHEDERVQLGDGPDAVLDLGLGNLHKLAIVIFAGEGVQLVARHPWVILSYRSFIRLLF